MSRFVIKVINYNDFEQEIKDWLDSYFEWYFIEGRKWIEQKIEKGDKKIIQLAKEIDFNDLKQELYTGDIDKFKNSEDVHILGLIDNENDEKLVGGLYLEEHNEDVWFLHRLWIDEEYRGDNLSVGLLNTAVSLAADHTVSKIRLTSGPFANQANKIYQRYGFEEKSKFNSTDVPELIHDKWNFYELEV